MKSYNGYSAEQRNKAYYWLKEKWESGEIPRPSKCCACGQDQGPIDAHAEDYSEPFGPHIQQYPLCYICHMMLHCRFRNFMAWNWYRSVVREGARFKPIGRNFQTFVDMFLNAQTATPDYFDKPLTQPLDRINEARRTRKED